MRRLTLLTASLVVLGFAAEPAVAQFATNTGGTGQSGRSGTSTTGTFGNTQRGGVSNRQQSSFGRGTSSASGSSIGGQSNPLANLGGADAMLSNRAQQQTGFVGRSAEDMQRFIGAAAAAQTQQGQGGGQTNFGGQQFGMGQNGRGQQGRGQGQGQNGQFGDMFDNQAAEQLQVQRRFRTKLSLGFMPAPQRVAAVTTSSTNQLTRSLRRSVGSAVEVQLADAVVVLTGTVPTTAEKLLAEQLALLEPGVARVQNDLVVADGTLPVNQ